METSDGTITNMFSINRDVFVFDFQSGLPVLNQHRVIGVKYKLGDIYYDLESEANAKDVCTLSERNIFASIDEALQVFNEGQDQLILTKKEETNP